MYEFGLTLNTPFDQAMERVRQVLMDNQLGIVSDVDVQATLKNKIGKDIPAYRILGACNPVLADRVLEAEPNAGTLLPCNLILRAVSKNETVVSFMDPVAVLGLSDSAEVKAVAAEARAKLDQVVAQLKG
jgi:uncharacterized protein (DUF302 family)